MDDLQQYIDKVLSTITLDQRDDSLIDNEYDINTEICRLIVDTRVSLGMTQKELAMISGITQANISKIENGNTRPSIATLQKLADSMNRRLVISFVDKESIE